jgi:hypothetical protein
VRDSIPIRVLHEGMERNSGREKRAKDMIIVPPEMKNKVR